MRRSSGFTAVAFLLAIGASTAQAQDADKAVAGGGISVAGWMGTVDPAAAKAGQTVNNAKLAKQGDALQVTTGPAITYWNPANKATGNYTVKATFREPKYMSLNNHPHPYGIVIAGNDMGTEQQSYLYCAAYGNGNFIVRGFGPEPFQVNGRRGETHAAVNKAAAAGEPVTQEIALSVKGDKVECAINGTVVGSYDKATLVTAGKLKSTDGVYGIRFAHNTEGLVTGLAMTKQ
jgi:D-alanyl-D-alanine carboxypeptidase